MDRIDIDCRVLERGDARLGRLHVDGPQNAILTEVKNHAIDGQVLEFNKAFAKGDKVYVFKTGCFDDHRNEPIGFQTHHLASSQVADTTSGLEIFFDNDAVRFRLDLSKIKNGAVIGRLCESGSHTAMSIGAEFEDAQEEVISGHKVTVVHKARLREISICKDGAAGDQAFAYLVDKTVVPKPESGKISARMNFQQAVHKIDRKIRGLKQRIAAMVDWAPAPAAVASISLDQLNQWQTEETERLQANALLRFI